MWTKRCLQSSWRILQSLPKSGSQREGGSLGESRSSSATRCKSGIPLDSKKLGQATEETGDRVN
jgi:hypothetical protein